MHMLTDLLHRLIEFAAKLAPEDTWLHNYPAMKTLLVIVIVSAICGAIGSLVVGNRMAFFSDALAHCAFAGVSLGMIFTLAAGLRAQEEWLLPAIMVAFGVVVGVL